MLWGTLKSTCIITYDSFKIQNFLNQKQNGLKGFQNGTTNINTETTSDGEK